MCSSIILANFTHSKYLNFLMKKTFPISYIVHRILYIFLLLLTSYITTAQWYDPLKVKTKATDIYLQAIANAQSGKLPVAIKMINDALKIEPRFVDACDMTSVMASCA